MRLAVTLTLFGTGLLAGPFVSAQPPDDGRANRSRGAATANLVERMMAFDTDQDEKLTKSEVTDARLKRLFDQADTDKDGLVTRNELNVLMVKERASARGNSAGSRGPGGMRRGFGGPGGGPGGFGGPGGGPGGFGGPGRGPGGFGGPPRPGQVLPPMLRQRLSLTADQEKQIDALQKDVDAKLAKILSDEQRQQLKEMSRARPWRAGRPRWPAGFRRRTRRVWPAARRRRSASR